MIGTGSGGNPPSFMAPYRVLRVVRVARGFAVVGETVLGPTDSVVTWKVRTFLADTRTEAEAEAEANAAAQASARRVPPWFSGRIYVVDSTGAVNELPPVN